MHMWFWWLHLLLKVLRKSVGGVGNRKNTENLHPYMKQERTENCLMNMTSLLYIKFELKNYISSWVFSFWSIWSIRAAKNINFYKFSIQKVFLFCNREHFFCVTKQCDSPHIKKCYLCLWVLWGMNSRFHSKPW